jgi:hypothetical protein
VVLPPQPPIRPVLLQVLADLGGRARPREIYPLVTQRFPHIQPQDLTAVLKDGHTNVWRNRIQWARQDLVLAGIVDPTERGIWKLTAKGHELARRGATAAELAPPKTRTSTAQRRAARSLDDEPAPDAAEEPAPETQPDAVGVLAALQTRPQVLAIELRSAAVDSRDPTRLERAVADAFGFLGFDVTSIGGPGNTDVLLQAPLGIRQYSVVVDAKSTTRARVADRQVDWVSIRDHREQERATYACVVGQDFAGGHLNTRAMEFQVSLLTIEELVEIVALHAETPLTLTELRALFVAVPTAKAALPQLRAAARERRRKRLLVLRVLAHIDNFNQVQPDIVLAKPETLLASILGERNPDLLGTTLDDVRRTLSLLETTGVISAANGDGYVSDTSMAGARQLLAAFAASPEVEAGVGNKTQGISQSAR